MARHEPRTWTGNNRICAQESGSCDQSKLPPATCTGGGGGAAFALTTSENCLAVSSSTRAASSCAMVASQPASTSRGSLVRATTVGGDSGKLRPAMASPPRRQMKAASNARAAFSGESRISATHFPHCRSRTPLYFLSTGAGDVPCDGGAAGQQPPPVVMASGNNDRHGMSSATTSRIGLRSQDEVGVQPNARNYYRCSAAGCAASRSGWSATATTRALRRHQLRRRPPPPAPLREPRGHGGCGRGLWGVCGGADRGLRQDLRRWLDVVPLPRQQKTGERRRVPDEGQMCSYVDTAPQRDELDFEFLGNRTVGRQITRAS
uniref:Uncharacterized protein n=1 Tax=Oryza rufipogon TaxID=4529 RepID=A0A0E0PUP2_ORYRU